ncbi:polysaccharide lyase family 7 protein [Streptomyces ipomoeae]|uniref:polysaccharide lyase family 7 protein n=1 Tax=Streptomyces ipomoeae TaxID=103232 RepID=UPI0011474B33|nr:polysaccharide lyase family 7 protein [Streptomyces ipomoeae]MDX2937880.1 cinnamyl alcohol dehydrogenase [Streptomyces ipomoeae]TQE28221.1 cinnamyl alcohol dehydrogenase [Streptomyces ipomoeae]
MNRRTVLRAGAGLLAGGTALALPQGPLASATTAATAEPAADPTDGWTQTSFAYSWQKPWNLDLADRHSYSGGVHRMWVHATDKPFEEGSTTDPRTEMRWKNDYKTGDRMWDADVCLPSGSDGASFVQILRSVRPSGTPATDIMLNVYDTDGGTVRRYDGTVLRTNAYDTWFNVKIAHAASSGTGTIKVYFDDSLVLTVADRGPATRYFKNGVYNHGSGRVEARFRDIRHWTR